MVASLDGSDALLFRHIPYLLQDVDFLGTDPDDVIPLLEEQPGQSNETCSAIDLGCGKGAVSVAMAERRGITVLGIDGVPEFIDTARKKALERGVASLCTFRAGDIRDEMMTLRDFNIAVLGSVGPVLGDLESTIRGAARCCASPGRIILDDAYLPDGVAPAGPYLERREFFRQIEAAGAQVLKEKIIDPRILAERNDTIFQLIRRRAGELMEQHPMEANLFQEYISRQADENETLYSRAVCTVLLLQVNS